MKRMKLLAALAAFSLTTPCFAAGPDTLVAAAEPVKVAPKIQLAILLDTSGSMDGLINQTREQLWRIVNTFATASRDGVRPTVELALYEYGNDGIPASDQYIRQVVPLTTNLDRVSEALFALRTNGGSEYCGAVIQKASQQLEWSSNPADLKLIYIAGNEPFTQGPVDFHVSVKAAISKGIVVNTIHAGPEQVGINEHWKEAALLADGNYLAIDQNRAVARVAAPQDAELARLSAQMNQTYVGYGAGAKDAEERQVKQDGNAQGLSASSASTRAMAKTSAVYDNSEWDLVDAKKKGRLEAIPAAALPPPIAAMKPEERKAYVETKEKERTEIAAKIQKLGQEREAYVQSELKKKAPAGEKTLDDAVLESAKAQGGKKAFKF